LLSDKSHRHSDRVTWIGSGQNQINYNVIPAKAGIQWGNWVGPNPVSLLLLQKQNYKVKENMDDCIMFNPWYNLNVGKKTEKGGQR